MIHINLLPVRDVETAPARRKEIVIAGLILCLACAAIARLHVVQSQQREAARAQVTGLESEIRQIRKEAREVQELVRKQDLLVQRLQAITSLTSPQRRSASVRILDDLSRSTPDLLWLTHFSEAKGRVQIQGAAVDNQTIAAFARNLARSPYFERVEIRETVQEQRGRLREEVGQVKKFLIETFIPAYSQEETGEAVL